MSHYSAFNSSSLSVLSGASIQLLCWHSKQRIEHHSVLCTRMNSVADSLAACLQRPKPKHLVLTNMRAEAASDRVGWPHTPPEDTVQLPCLPTPVEQPMDPIDRHIGQVLSTGTTCCRVPVQQAASPCLHTLHAALWGSVWRSAGCGC